MNLTPGSARALWYRALAAEIGIAIKVNADTKRLISMRLYDARTAAVDPELEKIMMVMPGKSKDEIWLCKKAVEL